MSSGEQRTSEERVDSALAAREQGFRAMKVRIGRDRLTEGVATVRALREALGEDFEIMVDLNQSWRMAGDLAGLRALRAETGVRVAAGEMLPSTSDLLSYLEHDALDVYQMDVVLAVGMHRARTIAEVAQLKHRYFTPHSWTNGIGVLANLHVAAGVGCGPTSSFPMTLQGGPSSGGTSCWWSRCGLTRMAASPCRGPRAWAWNWMRRRSPDGGSDEVA
jgi:D-galactarolactone cycloisomerase